MGVVFLLKIQRKFGPGWREDAILFYWKERKHGGLKAEPFGLFAGTITLNFFMLMLVVGRWQTPFGACRMRRDPLM